MTKNNAMFHTSDMNNLDDLSKQQNKPEIATVQAVDRALKLLSLIADSSTPILAAELANQAKLNRTTTWRLLATLEANGFVARDPLTKGYQLGYAATKLVSGTDQYGPLIRKARGVMERLVDQLQESVLLSVPKSFGILTIEQINPPNQSIRVADYINTIMPLYGTSNGKLFLSYLSDNELDIILDRPLEKFTAFTVTDHKELRKEIKTISEQGFAANFGELDENENGISAPILDKHGRPIAFLSVSGPSFRFTKKKLLNLAPTICASAQEITNKLEK